MQWKWIEGGIVMPVEVSGTWPATAGIRKGEEQWKEGG